MLTCRVCSHKAPVTGTTQTGGAYAAYDPNAPNTTGIAYGAGTAQQPYATQYVATCSSHSIKAEALMPVTVLPPTGPITRRSTVF